MESVFEIIAEPNRRAILSLLVSSQQSVGETDDVKGEYERIKARGAEFTMPPTDVTGATITMLNDTCGNLIQLTQLARYSG